MTGVAKHPCAGYLPPFASRHQRAIDPPVCSVESVRRRRGRDPFPDKLATPDRALSMFTFALRKGCSERARSRVRGSIASAQIEEPWQLSLD
jgi:hypothetical protein